MLLDECSQWSRTGYLFCHLSDVRWKITIQQKFSQQNERCRKAVHPETNKVALAKTNFVQTKQ